MLEVPMASTTAAVHKTGSDSHALASIFRM